MSNVRGVRRVSRFSLISLPPALALAGCYYPTVFHCDKDDQCAVGDTTGRCEQGGFCSRVDADCPGGYRYVEQSPDELAGSCVGGGGAGEGDGGDGGGGSAGDAGDGVSGCATAIAAGGRHTCAITSGGALYCWGAGDRLQLGSGGAGSQPRLVELAGGTVRSVAAGQDHTCAILDDPRQVECWGANDSGQLGVGGSSTASLPQTVVGSLDAEAVALGERHSCAIVGDGSVFCWGLNTDRQVDSGILLDEADAPTLTILYADATAIAAGGRHSAAVTGDGVQTWGAAMTPALGRGPSAGAPEEAIDQGGFVATAVTAGDAHTCELGGDGTVRCWGDGALGQLGLAEATVFAPTQVPGLADVDAVRAGGRHTCALAGSALVCFGDNSAGQLGAEGESGPEPRAIAGDWVEVAAGDAHTCARNAGGALFCWGANDDGQLGDDGPSRSEPRAVELPCGEAARRSVVRSGRPRRR
jgi:alpha-tubulin suppressor-like RCC1 family protein